MIRAGVFIGVEQTGGLTKLKDAVAGARRMYEWALAQGISENHARLITDEGGKKVTPEEIWDAVNALVCGAGVDQLIVYFAGHGVNLNRSEYWLLSDAPIRSSAAVDVTSSVELARYCGAGHVVFISDACRVAPQGIQAQNVRGQDIFPNDGIADRARPVDQFFACMLGRTSAEIGDPTQAATSYRALYTSALHDALLGKVLDVLDASSDAADIHRYVRPVKLQQYLEAEIPARIIKMKLTGKVNQSPDAILTAHSNWISRVAAPAATAQEMLQDTNYFPMTRSFAPGRRRTTIDSPHVLTRELVASALGADYGQLERVLDVARERAMGPAARVLDTIDRLSEPIATAEFPQVTAIKVRGRRIIEAYVATPAAVESVEPDGFTLELRWLHQPAVNVVLRMDDNCGTVVPALQGHTTVLTFEGGELVEVSFETSGVLVSQAQRELVRLRSIIGAAALHSRFVIDAKALIRLSQLEDPTIATLAAYAAHDAQLSDFLDELDGVLCSRTRTDWFDLVLLRRRLRGGFNGQQGVVPFTPLLARGWKLLKALRVPMPVRIENLERRLLPSLWCLYDSDGVDALKEALT